MRVHDSNLNSVSIGTNQSNRTDSVQNGRAGSSSARGNSSHDQISLSDLSSLVRSVSGETTGQSDKVNRLAAAYKSGTLSTNSHATAKGIVNDALRAK
jgi:anti-sigma28 factor (negative regulator of flagellin synthesis)